MHALRGRDNLEKFLERNVDLAIQGERGSAKIVRLRRRIGEKRNPYHFFK